MCHRIHSGMCYQFLWHCLCKFRINDCNIRCDLKVSDRIFDTFLIIGDDGKCSYLCCSSRSWGNRTEMRFLTKFWNTKHLAHILKCDIRIFVFDPHSLCRIDRRTSSDRNDPVRTKLFHRLCALHYGLHRWIRLNSFKKLYFHAGFFQILFCAVKKTETFHGTTAYADNRLFAFKRL